MRDIRFRGKRISNGEWVYGGFFGVSEEDGYVAYIYTSFYGATEVDEKTIGQFTGLKDKNGTGNIFLYEGDVLNLDGNIIGNIYENEYLLKGNSNLVITSITSKDWIDAQKKAVDRGFGYPF